MRAVMVMGAMAAAGAHASLADIAPGIGLTGTGVQFYACVQADAGPAWRLKGPEAVLTDAAGERVGRHFAGPTWQANDGSTVVGEVRSTRPSTRPSAIPWLELDAKAHSGDGLFSVVTSIRRTDTEGGMAPASGCDAGHAGEEVRVPYSATYYFVGGAQRP